MVICVAILSFGGIAATYKAGEKSYLYWLYENVALSSLALYTPILIYFGPDDPSICDKKAAKEACKPR